jgi:hypothetical protein
MLMEVGIESWENWVPVETKQNELRLNVMDLLLILASCWTPNLEKWMQTICPILEGIHGQAELADIAQPALGELAAHSGSQIPFLTTLIIQ